MLSILANVGESVDNPILKTNICSSYLYYLRFNNSKVPSSVNHGTGIFHMWGRVQWCASDVIESNQLFVSEHNVDQSELRCRSAVLIVIM